MVGGSSGVRSGREKGELMGRWLPGVRYATRKVFFFFFLQKTSKKTPQKIIICFWRRKGKFLKHHSKRHTNVSPLSCPI